MFLSQIFNKSNQLESLVCSFVDNAFLGVRRGKYPVVIRSICDVNLIQALAKSGYVLSKKEIKKAKKIAQGYLSRLGYKARSVQYTRYFGSWILECVIS